MSEDNGSVGEKATGKKKRNPVTFFLIAMFLGGGLLHYTSLAAMQRRIITLENVVRAALPVQDNNKEVDKPNFDL